MTPTPPKVDPKTDLPIHEEIRQSQAEAAQGLVVPYKFGPASEEELDWENMAPVGREFGSPDYEWLMAEDAAKFASDLQEWIKVSQASIDIEEVAHALREFPIDANNVQTAIRELGQDVSIHCAAAVWIHYSQSLCAGWMAGADTVASAARTLYLNCPGQT